MNTTLSRGTLSLVEEITMTERLMVHEHKESKAKYVAFPFVFPDGYPATIVITKGIKSKWKPIEDLDKITLHFK